MTFIKHENFPLHAAELIQVMENHERGESSIKLPQDLYGDDVKPDEWFTLIGNQNRAHRPTILCMDSGVRENDVSLKAMRDSGCSFVVLQDAWADKGVQAFAWRILKVWPDVVRLAEAAHDAGRQCRILVPIRGNPRVINL